MLTRPTTPPGGFPFGEVEKIFAANCRLYFSLGNLTGEEPATKAANLALYTGGTAKFVPLGHMNDGIGDINWKQNTNKIDFHELGGTIEVTGTMNSVRVYDDFITFLVGSEAKQELSVLVVPDGDDGSTFLALSGVSMFHEGNIALNGKPSTVKLSFRKTCNKLTDVVKLKNLTT